MSSSRKKAVKASKAKPGPQTIPLTPALRQQFQAFQNLMAGARMQADVPNGWMVNQQGTAFVPPPKMPDLAKKPDKKKE